MQRAEGKALDLIALHLFNVTRMRGPWWWPWWPLGESDRALRERCKAAVAYYTPKGPHQ